MPLALRQTSRLEAAVVVADLHDNLNFHGIADPAELRCRLKLVRFNRRIVSSPVLLLTQVSLSFLEKL